MPYYRRSSSRGYSAQNQQRIQARRVVGLVLVGDTYAIKDEIKAAGGLWDRDSRGWAMPDVDTYNTFAARLGLPLRGNRAAMDAIAAASVAVATADDLTQTSGNYRQPATKPCGSCKSLIAAECGCTAGDYYTGPALSWDYEECPSCSHAFAVA